MEPDKALKVIEALADGVHPITGEVFPDGSPYQNPDVIRALFAAAEALKARRDLVSKKYRLPENAGKKWEEEEVNLLVNSFKRGETIPQLAQRHKRTRGAIQSKLAQLGLIEESEAYFRRTRQE